MDKIAVIESGVAGRVWAIVFARAGFNVSFYESSPVDGAESLRWIRVRLQELRSYGRLADPEDEVMARISAASSLEAALDGAIHAQESGEDTLAAKIAIFARMDQIAGPNTVLASSTSVVFPTEFSEHVPGRNRCIVVHPVQPPYALRAVEIIPGRWTSPETTGRSRALIERCGLVPVMIQREVPGYVINSLQIALAAEAFRLVSEGVASAEDCEAVVKHGLGLRWSFMGPFETAGINAPGGVADYFTRQADFFNMVRATQTPVKLTPELIGAVDEAMSNILKPGASGERREWRDRRLMALAEHQSKQPE
jgi:3-hydroxyacyl-CoA dehydrogenase